MNVVVIASENAVLPFTGRPMRSSTVVASALLVSPLVFADEIGCDDKTA